MMQNRNQWAESCREKIFISDKKNMNKTAKKIIAVAVLLAVWQAAAMLLNKKLLLASPVDVVIRLFTLWKEPGFAAAIGFSFIRIAGGFLLAFVIGIVLAVLAAGTEWVGILLSPVMVTIKTVPVASFVIIALVWLSSGKLSLFISFLIVLPVIYNNVLGGIRSMDVKMLQMADVYKLPWSRRFRYIWLPTIKPFLMSAATTALGMAWKSGVAAEVIGIPDGSIGEMLYNAKIYLNTADLFAWTVIIVLVSVLFEKVFMWLLRKAYNGYCR